MDTRARLRKLEREINGSNDEKEITQKMGERRKLYSEIFQLQAELSQKIPAVSPSALRLFSTVNRSLEIYGRGIRESIMWSFEAETGFPPLELVRRPRAFHDCLEKIFGQISAERIERAIIFEIGKEFAIQFSKTTDLEHAVLLISTMKGKNSVS